MYHFIGIKGSGMSAMANIILDLGYQVTGSDVESFIFTQVNLENRGVQILPFSANNIKDNQIVIVGNSFKNDHEEVKAALENPNVEVYRYRDYLGKLLTDFDGVSVTGTHGKTTTTGMLAHVLEPLKRGYLIGDGTGQLHQDAQYFIAESCEYQGSFLSYHPNYAVVLNMELDHVDYFQTLDKYNATFQKFVQQVKKGLALNGDDINVRSLKTDVKTIYFGLEKHNDVIAKNIIDNETNTLFDLYYHEKYLGQFMIPLVGSHFLYDALGCISVLLLMNIDVATIKERLATFGGTKRRFNVEKNGDYIYIDDYGHHPTEISATLLAARKAYPNKKIVAVFKPDRPSRIMYFLAEFKEALALADVAYITEYLPNTFFNEGELSAQAFAQYCNVGFIAIENEEYAKLVAKNEEAVYIFMSTKDVYKFKNILKVVHESKNY